MVNHKVVYSKFMTNGALATRPPSNFFIFLFGDVFLKSRGRDLGHFGKKPPIKLPNQNCVLHLNG